MLKKILIGLGIAIVGLVIVILLQPATYRVERSITIAAPPEKVFSQVNDFHRWNAWNPWGKIDPAMKQSYAGPESGVGAQYSWVGNKNVGEGRMTIAESVPNDKVKIDMEFLKPFGAQAKAEFTFKALGNGTLATWSMSGDKNFIAKALHLFMNMDKMIGGQFQKGLADLKTVAEQ